VAFGGGEPGDSYTHNAAAINGQFKLSNGTIVFNKIDAFDTEWDDMYEC
jgi:hypothetical protein